MISHEAVVATIESYLEKPTQELFDRVCDLVEELIGAAVHADDAHLLRQCEDVVSFVQYNASGFPEPIFDILIRTGRNAGFWRGHNTWILLNAISGNWEGLSQVQRESLVALLEKNLSGSSSMMCFAITEFLGDHYHGQQALDLASRLLADHALPCRRFVPHLLEHIVRANPNSGLGDAAFAELSALVADPAQEVREEVRLSLERILGTRKRESGSR